MSIFAWWQPSATAIAANNKTADDAMVGDDVSLIV